ncbi:MAG: replication-associated recombination protein A [Candidatus Electrothrix aestuarii]|uniref:Replication-associated recombination protein A n=1 Tax=Candidatus Electrothrix aestuarii TaxID=3062594 RepID=A0AAU8M0H8_9BACT|nr:replication-associated recombination protein A [Candidatus Electrothrix aestuarii]
MYKNKKQEHRNAIPLAERMRPVSLDDFYGQEHLVGRGRLLHELISKGKIPSLLLWGPPGSGKTTLASILAHSIQADFIFFSAVLSGVKEIRKIVNETKEKKGEAGGQTILFVDEIHRFNKSQQDALLPHVESGLLTLIGATTENPSFEVIAPLLSRCQMLLLQPLAVEDITGILQRAVQNQAFGLGNYGIALEEEIATMIARAADGDCRRALNYLETAALLIVKKEGDAPLVITRETVHEVLQGQTLRYDRAGEEHYNLISALHKSLRDSDPDGACYWLGRMLVSGEDPLYIARRLIRFASEDIGVSDPRALEVAISCRRAYEMLGSPEGELALYQVTVYLATAPKSNALYLTEKKVKNEIRRSGSLPVPLHLRNAPTGLMKKIGYGKDYQYAHDAEDGLVVQEHLPEPLAGRRFYLPTERGFEAVIHDRLTKWRKILQQRAQQQKNIKRQG